MRLVLSSSLFGNIESMAAVRFPGTSKDALLLSFRDAKVPSTHMSLPAISLTAHAATDNDTTRAHTQISVLEFDIATNDLRTISLHYFEDYKVKVHSHYFILCPASPSTARG
jgi:cleavage and polyadenylation specificity factor subunit 1